VFVSGFTGDAGSPELFAAGHKLRPSANFTLHLGSLQFDRRGAMQIRYRVAPGSDAWQTAPGFDLRLGKLGSGVHTLEVQARVGTGPWSPSTTESFTIALPAWLTWQAMSGYALAGTVLLAGGRRWWMKRTAKLAGDLPGLGEMRLAALLPELQQIGGAILDSRFEVGRILARGGFAAVLEGFDRAQQCRCAIKVFRQDLADEEWLARRFEQEVRALEQIHHANVVRIYARGTLSKGALYLVMEFIEGDTLREILEGGKLPPGRAASYLKQIGAALGEIHAHGICHRDLKPENLMIRNDAPPNTELVLIDFSIAIVQDPDKTVHGLSRAAGTISYMAPEQAIGYAEPASDVYSLARILIEMLTGERLSALLPDASMDLPERTFELLRRLDFGLSTASLELIGSALRFDPARRPSDARAFADQIARELEQSSPAT
jgi:tRNA A-37 threonylcarbamoyl transferase component Bud32